MTTSPEAPAGSERRGRRRAVRTARSRRRGPGCELCEAARFTHWYHEDDVCWVADCEVCETPMVVWRHHGTEPPEDQSRAHAGPPVGGGGEPLRPGGVAHRPGHAADPRPLPRPRPRPTLAVPPLGRPAVPLHRRRRRTPGPGLRSGRCRTRPIDPATTRRPNRRGGAGRRRGRCAGHAVRTGRRVALVRAARGPLLRPGGGGPGAPPPVPRGRPERGPSASLRVPRAVLGRPRRLLPGAGPSPPPHAPPPLPDRHRGEGPLVRPHAGRAGLRPGSPRRSRRSSSDYFERASIAMINRPPVH